MPMNDQKNQMQLKTHTRQVDNLRREFLTHLVAIHDITKEEVEEQKRQN